MPIINVSVGRGHTAEQLHNLMAGISRATVDSLAVPESAIRVLVHEVDPAMWFSGGQTLQDKRHPHGRDSAATSSQ
jgi:4-oxalocrotonate tautomerase